MLPWNKCGSTAASELRCRSVRMRADFLVGYQCNQELTAFTPVLPQPMKTFYFPTILLQRGMYANSLQWMCNFYYIIIHYMLSN